MQSGLFIYAIEVVMIVLQTIGILYLMRAITQPKRNSRIITNYAGRQVYGGLGWIWIIWAVLSIGIVILIPSWQTVAPIVLAVGCFVFGHIDDRRGVRGAGGFHGHMRALLRGSFTTGLLKLFGIGVLSLGAGFVASQANYWTMPATTGGWAWVSVAGWTLIAGAAIALTANFVNLCDLRPVRASKVYVFLLLIALVIGLCVRDLRTVSLFFFIWFVGPVCATWTYDANEIALLGDAGANPMGAVAGFFLCLLLPWWGLVLYLLVVLALNLCSEKVSYSAVVERTPWLRALDDAGRRTPPISPDDDADETRDADADSNEDAAGDECEAATGADALK
ncbi:MAG: hypothetical protein LBS17_02860 [Actinomycetes bacterium]|jgi:hypothetical protein|nr:hypothetical protein [Actinomycetes bacterium]